MCEKTNEEEAEIIIFILVLSSFLSVKSFLKIWVNHFSLLIFESFKPSLPLFLTIEGKRLIRLIFLSVSTIWTVKYCTKTLHFQILISFSLCYYLLQTIFSPAPVRQLVLVVLHNGVKKHSREKGLICEVVSERRIAILFGLIPFCTELYTF